MVLLERIRSTATRFFRHSDVRDLASGLLAFSIVVLARVHPSIAINLVFAIGIGLAMSIRNRLPWIAYGISAVVMFGASDLGSGTPDTVLILVAYALASQSAIAPWVIGLSTFAVLLLANMVNASIDKVTVASVLTAAFLAFVPVGLARVQRRASELAKELSARNAELELLRRGEVERALYEERNRIARDLHDVVAHHVSAISLRAKGAQRMLARGDADSAGLAESLAFIGSSSSDALVGMRAMVGALRNEGDSAPTASQPTLADIESLVATANGLGRSVLLSLRADVESVPSTIGLCCYRVVQEALTNIAKHSNARNVEVTISAADQILDLTVTDDGRPRTAGLESGGNGIAGMRERVSLSNGALAIGPATPTGWRVHARFPLSEAVRA